MHSLFLSSPRPGDTVRLVCDLPAGLLRPALSEGSRALVVATSWGHVELVVDGGLAGMVRVDVSARNCRVIEADTGAERFRRRTALRNAVRIGALIALAAPFVQFVASYWFATGSLDGLLEYLPLAALESAGDFLVSALRDPVRSLLLAGVGWVTWVLAFGRLGRRKR
ncbi:hypothetical protein C3B59_17345 [Cryobacterium zongtaii]|uniref:Uncharacterized protein n=2 Tax=Cryobacterium zongtaii TaxID=1259217 RepID=A0A2S3Z630_9MICO|nr:hypothetical protein C3B59_17345 [Cryobacterium zongtaii]